MTDISNGDQQTPALGGRLATALRGRLAIDSIVKVACIFPVNGHQRHIGQIDTIQTVLGAHFVRQCSRQSDTGFRKLVWHTVFAHRDLNFHTWIINFTKYFLDASHRLPKQSRWLDQFNHHHLPRLGHTGGPFGDQDILAIALVFRCNQPDAAFLQQASDDGL